MSIVWVVSFLGFLVKLEGYIPLSGAQPLGCLSVHPKG